MDLDSVSNYDEVKNEIMEKVLASSSVRLCFSFHAFPAFF